MTFYAVTKTRCVSPGTPYVLAESPLPWALEEIVVDCRVLTAAEMTDEPALSIALDSWLEGNHSLAILDAAIFEAFTESDDASHDFPAYPLPDGPRKAEKRMTRRSIVALAAALAALTSALLIILSPAAGSP